jgi:hypothetical protein
VFIVNKLFRIYLTGGVAFSSYMPHPEPSPGKHQTLIFDSEISNVGGHYNHHGGMFMSPDNGIYTFTWSIHCYNPSSFSFFSTELVINSNPVGASLCTGTTGQYAHTSGNAVVQINEGDLVFNRIHPTSSLRGQIWSSSDSRSTFSGWKLFS